LIRMKKLVTEQDILNVWKSRKRKITVHPQAIVTPAAKDAAHSRGIQIIKAALPKSVTGTVTPTNFTGEQTIILGSDHGGFELKEILKQFLLESGRQVDDIGTHSTESVDYPDFAHEVARKVAADPKFLGIVIDGAGVGSAMAANKVPGIRAASCQDVYTARNSRVHNNANVLTLGCRVLGIDVAKEIVTTWLNSHFEGGRHQRRVDKIMLIEQKYR